MALASGIVVFGGFIEEAEIFCWILRGLLHIIHGARFTVFHRNLLQNGSGHARMLKFPMNGGVVN
jgi:hypothetical protein